MRRYFLAAFLSLVGAPVLAEDFITGVYLQSEDLCAQAQSEGLQSVIEASNMVLTARGLDSIEYNCEFVQVTRSTRQPAWLVTALCQEPGYMVPDVLSILELSPTQLDVVSVKPADTESGSAGNTASYYLCAGVALP